MAQSRVWDFTLNNYTDDEVETVKRWSTEVKKLTVSKELGEAGTPHLQGRVTFARAYRLAALKKLLPRAHWEATKAAQDSLYVLKVGSEVIVQVDNREQGKRTDLAQACELVKQGIGKSRPLREVAKEMPGTFARYHKGLEALANELVEDRNEVPTVTVLYGPSGVGKSRLAREMLGADVRSWNPSKKEWFDGYCGQKDYLFEEFRGQLQYGMMLALLDRYTTDVQVKGGMRSFVATNIVITSPVHPREWYPNLAANDKIDQLMRRITRCMRVGEENLLDQDTDSEDPLEPVPSYNIPDGTCSDTVCSGSGSDLSSEADRYGDEIREEGCEEGRQGSGQEDQGGCEVPSDLYQSGSEDRIDEGSDEGSIHTSVSARPSEVCRRRREQSGICCRLPRRVSAAREQVCEDRQEVQPEEGLRSPAAEEHWGGRGQLQECPAVHRGLWCAVTEPQDGHIHKSTQVAPISYGLDTSCECRSRVHA